MHAEIILVGGGLQGGLIALALRHLQPASRVLLLEQADRVGGNHTWSFHAADLPIAAEPFVHPLLAARWPGYRVHFPGFSRRLACPYASIRSEALHEAVCSALNAPGCALWLNSSVRQLTAHQVQLIDGKELTAELVIDARGLAGAEVTPNTGFQKFVGWEIETADPWPDSEPTVMDATVPQGEDYRFLYILPFSPRRVLVEDTSFSDTSTLDKMRLGRDIAAWLAHRGIKNYRILREEAGVLPMPWRGPQRADQPNQPLKAGYAGGWFHPATGYSFPLAVRLALLVASHRPAEVRKAVERLATQLAPRQRFAYLLNWLLFRLVDPAGRWHIFRRLYRTLPESCLNRFYALDFTPLDATRILLGWPPPLAPLRCLRLLFAQTSTSPYRSDVIPCP